MHRAGPPLGDPRGVAPRWPGPRQRSVIDYATRQRRLRNAVKQRHIRALRLKVKSEVSDRNGAWMPGDIFRD
jgi:hypothetical protein